jgi:hypothetical protein
MSWALMAPSPLQGGEGAHLEPLSPRPAGDFAQARLLALHEW